MALYKYVSNKDAQDGTEELGLPGSDVLVPLGGEIELTDAEYDQYKQRFNLRKAGDSDEEKEEATEEKTESGSGQKPALRG